MDNAIAKVLRCIEEESKRRFLPIVGRKKGKLLECLVKENQPKLILEIGTLVGYSSILMARSLKKGKIISIEISPKSANIAKRNLKNAGFEDKIKVITGNALTIIPKLKERFELIFIDAAKDEYLQYLLLLEKNSNLEKGSIIVADNVKIFADTLKSYLEYIRGSKRYKSKYYDFVEDGMDVSICLRN